MTDRHGVAVIESHTSRSQRVDVWRLPASASVSSDWLTPNVVREDKDDIGAIVTDGNNRAAESSED